MSVKTFTLKSEGSVILGEFRGNNRNKTDNSVFSDSILDVVVIRQWLHTKK